jgi:crossover junction endodeoxyribonuclease RusA
MKEIILVLNYPPSSNRYWQTRVMNARSAGGRPMATTYVSAEAKKFKQHVFDTARAAGVQEPILGRVRLDIMLYPHRPLDWEKRKRIHGANWDDTVQSLDLGNCEKVLSDALQGVVIGNDKFIRKIVQDRMEPDEHGARVVVRVTAIGAA